MGLLAVPFPWIGAEVAAVWLPQLSPETEIVVGTQAEPFHCSTSPGLFPDRVPKTPLGSTVASLVPVPLYTRTRKRPPSTSSRSVGVVVPMPKLPCAQRKCSPASHSQEKGVRLRILQICSEKSYKPVLMRPERLPISKTPVCRSKRLFPTRSIFSDILM